MVKHFAYDLLDDPRPTVGLIVLQADETIESDFHKLFSPDAVRLHVNRIQSDRELTQDSIHEMARDLPRAAGLFPYGLRFDVVGYACTSGTTLIGEDKVETLVRRTCAAKAVTNPLTAALAAFKVLGLSRIGIVSPYVETVAEPLRQAFESGGIKVPNTLSFGEEVERNVARISPHSLTRASQIIAAETHVDGIFLSCTNLKTLGVIENLEAELGLPVISSNTALAWHMARRAHATVEGPGKLFRS